MIEVEYIDFSRAIYHHRLNVTYSCNWIDDVCHGVWKLGYTIVCKQNHGKFPNNTIQTLVSDEFKKRYIDTTPDEAFRCRTCCRINKCSIVRSNKEDFCCVWTQDDKIKAYVDEPKSL